jgi:hypothetical protein
MDDKHALTDADVATVIEDMRQEFAPAISTPDPLLADKGEMSPARQPRRLGIE